MDTKLIEAFHQYDSFNDIIDHSEVSSKGFEKIIIETIREQFKRAEIKKVEPDVEEEKAPMVANSSEIDLSDEQLDFVHRALNGENLFLTCGAGYGKSAAIAECVSQLRAKYDKPGSELESKVAICASTGVAAKLINGRTLHSFLGIGLAKESPDKLFERLITVRRMKPKYYELKALKVLIIDEISMINNILFDKISRYFELIKDSDEPFGGSLQVICVGDLAQLKPIEGNFMFKSASFRDMYFSIVQFTKCFRQNDVVFQTILKEARFAQLSSESYKILMKQNSIDEELFKGIKPILLCPTNREVDAINQKYLNDLLKETGATEHTYNIKYITSDTKKADMVMKMEGIEEVVLAVGAQVIVTTNISMGGSGPRICNGSQGRVVQIFPDHIILDLIDFPNHIKMEYTKVLDPECNDFDKPVFLFSYMSLRLGYAISIHKSQGLSTNCLEVNLARVFTHGQAYVAISRCRSLEGLKVTGLKKGSFMCDKAILEFYSNC